jgi:hypothetical protein
VALFSDVDWVIIAVVAAIMFLGPQGRPFVRQMGRWYGRLLQFKNELMSEVGASAGLGDEYRPTPRSIRSAWLGTEPRAEPHSTPVALGSHPGVITQVQPVALWAVDTQSLGAGLGVGTWWVVSTDTPGEVVRLR